MSCKFKVGLICYPYYPSRDTGRGHDRYIFEVKDGIEKLCPDIKLRLLHQGFSKGVLGAGTRGLKLIADLTLLKADLFHAASPVGAAVAIFLRKSPLVVTIHDLVPFHVREYDYSWKLSYVRLCTEVSARRSDAIIVPYHTTKEELVNRFNISESKVHVVSYGVDHGHYYPRSRRKDTVKRVLYIGSIDRAKGVDVLIRAFGIVEKEMSDVELLIGGKGSRDQPALERLAQELGTRHVIFAGYIPENELPEYYATAEVLAYPSRYGFGLSTLEAMACGTPTIVGATLDAPEFVAEAGILVNPDNIHKLADAMLRILKDDELRAQLSKKALERSKAFSWRKTAAETIQVYQKVIED